MYFLHLQNRSRFAIFQSAYCYATMKKPSLLNTIVINFPFSKDYAHRFADVHIYFDGLIPSHSAVSIRAALTRLSTIDSFSTVVNVNHRLELYSFPIVVEPNIGL
jgi:hypothetical protein